MTIHIQRFRLPAAATKGAAAFTAAMAVNVVLFSMVTALNHVVEVAPASGQEEEASFAIQELPPPEPVRTPPEEPEPRPEQQLAEMQSETSPDEPSPLPPLELGLASLGGLGVVVRPPAPEGRPAGAPVRERQPRIFQRGEVDSPVRPVACSTSSRQPAVARRRGLSASVRVRAVVDPSGGIRMATVAGMIGDGHPAFAREALRHLKSCRFEPARKDGRAVSQWVERVYEFADRG